MRPISYLLFAMGFFAVGVRADIEWMRVEVADVILSKPVDWQKVDVQGIDTLVVRYAHRDFTLEVEVGGVMSKGSDIAAEEIAELEKKRRDPASLRESEEIVEVRGRLGEVRTMIEDHHVAYAGFARLVQLYLPMREGGYATIRVFYRSEAEAPTAMKVIRSVTMKERQPNQALQTTSVTRSGSGKVSDSDRHRLGV